jgi:hypothetical protein
MKKKNYLILDDEFIMYCQINKIDDIEKLAKETFSRGFTILKYGEIPRMSKSDVRIVEKEVIKEVEVVKEIPIEKIVEVIKEVPVEKETIIKEVIENKDELIKLTEENKKLREDLNNITKSLESMNRARYLKNSDMGSLYGE